MAKVELEIEGKKYTVECSREKTLLEAALDKGIEAPYSCMSGVCNTCQASLVAGQVEMEFCDALSEEEIQKGEILTCQARPVTDEISVVYRGY